MYVTLPSSLFTPPATVTSPSLQLPIVSLPSEGWGGGSQREHERVAALFALHQAVFDRFAHGDAERLDLQLGFELRAREARARGLLLQEFDDLLRSGARAWCVFVTHV